MSFLSEIFGAKAIRVFPKSVSSIYLTFDDGPDDVATPIVLDLLRAAKCSATFFLIAEKAKQSPQLVRKILEDGHTIGNHSLDHRYAAFFQSQQSMLNWIDASTAVFESLTNASLVGFRPPAGIVNPKLVAALRARSLPLILWNKRFYDTAFDWTPAKAERAAKTLKAGSVVLLHDSADVSWIKNGSESLEVFLDTAKHRGLRFEALTRDLCLTLIKA